MFEGGLCRMGTYAGFLNYLNALCKPRKLRKPRANARPPAPPLAPPTSGQAEGSGFARLPRMRGVPGRGGRRGLAWPGGFYAVGRCGPGRARAGPMAEVFLVMLYEDLPLFCITVVFICFLVTSGLVLGW